MKKQIFFSPILVIFFCSIFGCEKIPDDYRNKYWGEYDFTYNYYSIESDGSQGDKIHGFDTEGRIYYNKKDADNSLIIEIPSINLSMPVEITLTGYIITCSGEGQTDGITFYLLHNLGNCPVEGLTENTYFEIIGFDQ